MKRLLYGLLGIAAMSLGSCMTDNAGADSKSSSKLSVFVTTGDMEVGLAKTRASLAPETGEDVINDLYLLFFESNAAGDGVFVDVVPVEGPLTMNTKFDIDLTETSIDVIQPYRILAVANIDGADGSRYLNGLSVENWIQQWVGKTENEVVSQAAAWTAAGFRIEPSGLLMNGRVEKRKSQFHVDLVLSRNQARFDVLNDVKNDYDLVEVQICNAYPSSSIWNGGDMDYTHAVGRISTYYGYTNPDPSKDILGYLYAFENQVPMPVQNDRFTTALLVRLHNKATDTDGWYRINIAPDESAQTLRRDNAYRLTIQNVAGAGFPTAQQAFEDPNMPELDYVINYWDQNNSGVIVQDGSSILSIPSKTVRFGRDGGASTFQIFAFSNSPNAVSPLTIVSQRYTPSNGQINATLTGNTMTITAAAMPANESVRNGTITLGFAGLQATIEVVQSGAADKFIQVILPNNTNIPKYAPFAGLSSDLIRVSASGAWTAEIFSESADDFSFGDPDAGAIHRKISSANSADAPYITDNRFRIYTFSANPDPSVRDAFIVVSLDDDPENNAVVFRVSQAAAGGISILPNQATVTFNGSNTGLAQIPNNTTTEFNVRPSEVESGGSMMIPNWEWKFLDTDTGTWVDTNDWFAVVGQGHSTADPNANKFTVAAKDMNLSGLMRTATLRLRLVDDHSVYVDLKLAQQPLTFNLQPSTVPVVAKTGGRTQNIAVEADNSLEWSAQITTVSGTASDGRRLVQHLARLFTEDGTEVDPSQNYPMNTKFYVEFPKVYYPNRDIPISATVTVTVAGSLAKTMTVTQTPLKSNGFVGLNIAGSTNDWGLLGNTYNRGWDAGLARIPGWGRVTPDGNFNTVSINPAATYLHVVPQQSGSAAAAWNWNAVHEFIDNDRGWVVIAQQSDDVEAANNNRSPIKMAGYNDLVYGGGTPYSGTFNSSNSATKLYQFVMDKGMTPITASDITLTFTTDGIRTSIPGPWPSSAVVFISRTNVANNALLIVDVEHGFMYIGESQLFWRDSDADLSNNRGTFMNNLLQFIANASMYGTHFTDLLLETGRPDAQPAPWDSYWGDNRASTPNGVSLW